MTTASSLLAKRIPALQASERLRTISHIAISPSYPANELRCTLLAKIRAVNEATPAEDAA